MFKWLLGLFVFLISSFSFASDDISGFWKTSDDEGEGYCIIAIYEYDGLYYGRIIATFDGQGQLEDSIYKPVKRAPGVIGNPFYSGLDIIWGLMDVGVKFKGKILDPRKGNIYNSELWLKGQNLVVRGKYLIFGRSQEWVPASDVDFPKGFKKPDLQQLVPSIPQVN